jgi:hypothetical protein
MKQRDERAKGEVYFTTGKISALLGKIVSQATVSRLFDRGELEGELTLPPDEGKLNGGRS